MPVYSVWESQFPPAAAHEGRQITEAIWRDMVAFDGYLTHALIEDLGDPGHLLVVSQWESRAHADQALRDYTDDPKARRANELVERPRTRFLGRRRP